MKFTLSFLALLLSGQFVFAQIYTFPSPYAGYLFPSGNVGIGTGSTTAAPWPLTVYSTGTGLAQFKTTAAGNSAISIVNASGQMNLGIGATTPHPYLWSTTGDFMIGNDGGPTVFVKGMGSGSVGINTMTPFGTFDVNGMIHTNTQVYADQPVPGNAGVWVRGTANNSASVCLQGGAGNWQNWWITGDNGVFRIGGNGGAGPYPGVLQIDYNGNAAFGGNTASNYKLDVYGNLRANEVVVNTTGADYVFDTTYRLPSLQNLDKYVHTYHHLPDVSPASQMQQEGLSVGENQTLLLKKIEELTLYILEQDKKMAKMQSELDDLKANR
jgi:hypothetical protein